MEVILSKQCESLVGMLESDKGPSQVCGTSFFCKKYKKTCVYAIFVVPLRRNLEINRQHLNF